MHFVQPVMLLGALGAAAPLVAHLLSPNARREVPFAPIALLPSTDTVAAGRKRAQDGLLLLVRMLLLAMLAVYMARPTTEAQVRTSDTEQMGPQVIVIDASGSMNYRTAEGTLLARGRRLAHQQISNLPAGTQVAIVVALGAKTAVAALPLTAEHAVAHEAIDRLTPPSGAKSIDLGAALVQAAALVPASMGTATVRVISDLCASSLARRVVDLPWPAAPPQLIWLDAAARPASSENAKKPALPNLAVASMRTGPGPTVAVDLVNFGSAAVARRGLTVQVQHQQAQRALVDVAANSQVTKFFAVSAPSQPRALVTAQLDDDQTDGYGADDRLQGELLFAPAIKVLAVDGAPATTQTQTELYYLERALSQIPEGQGAIVVHAVPRSGLLVALQDARSTPYDVLVLANVGGLSDAEVQGLLAMNLQGTGLVVALGDQVILQGDQDAAAYSQLMPFDLRDLAQNAQQAPSVEGRVLGAIAEDHPVFAGLAPASVAALRQVRTQQFIFVAAEARRGARMLAAFDDGAPALIEAEGHSGQGKVLLWSSSFDADWTDLPMRGVFVPWIQLLLRYAGQRSMGSKSTDGQEDLRALADLNESDFRPAAPAALELPDGDSWHDVGRNSAQKDDKADWGLGVTILGVVWLLAAAEAWLARGPKAQATAASA